MSNFNRRDEMIAGISSEILANGLADTREEAVKMAREWVDTAIEDMAY